MDLEDFSRLKREAKVLDLEDQVPVLLLAFLAGEWGNGGPHTAKVGTLLAHPCGFYPTFPEVLLQNSPPFPCPASCSLPPPTELSWRGGGGGGRILSCGTRGRDSGQRGFLVTEL